MKKEALTLTFLLAIIMTMAFSNCQSAQEKNTTLSTAQLFKRHCVVCHGSNGKLKLNGAKDLQLSELSMEERITVIKHGRGLMTGFGSLLSSDQIMELAKHTTQLKIEPAY